MVVCLNEKRILDWPSIALRIHAMNVLDVPQYRQLNCKFFSGVELFVDV